VAAIIKGWQRGPCVGVRAVAVVVIVVGGSHHHLRRLSMFLLLLHCVRASAIALEKDSLSSLLPDTATRPVLAEALDRLLHPLKEEQSFLEAEVAFRDELTRITSGNLTLPAGGPPLAFCTAVSQALSVLSYTDVFDVYNAMTGLTVDLASAFADSGYSIAGGGRHLLGAVVMNVLLAKLERAREGPRITLAVRDLIIRAASTSVGPIKSGMVEYGNGALVHGAIWTYLSTGVGSNAPRPPGQAWSDVLTMCADLFRTEAFLDCMHGFGHGAMMYAVLYVDGAQMSGNDTCTYMEMRSHAVTRTAVHVAVESVESAPGRGMVHSASRGMWMTMQELGNDETELPPRAWLLNTSEATAELLDRGLFCAFEPIISAFCFSYIAGTDAEVLSTVSQTPTQIVSDCLTVPMVNERARRGCIFGMLEAYTVKDVQAYTGEEPFEPPDPQMAINTCAAIANGTLAGAEEAPADDQRLRALACIAGQAWGYGEAIRATQRLSVAVINQMAPPGPNMCELMASDTRWGDSDVSLCEDTFTLCIGSSSTCGSPLDYLARAAQVLDA